MTSQPIERYFLLSAILYAILGMALGITMGMIQDFSYQPVHAHISLVGWVSLAIFGIVYKLYPNAGRNRWAIVHFIVATIGTLTFLPGIWLVRQYHIEGPIIIGSLLVILSMILFLINIARNAR